jgi:hemerythrin
MGIVDWTDKYSVAIESIDNDHKQLIGIINQLFNAMTKGEGAKVISPLVDELQKYTVYHFNREETFFRMTNYPNAFQHNQEHALFIQKVKEFKTKIGSGNTTFSPDLLNFLRDWLLNHITNVDAMYAEHFKKYGLK